jgi:uncharacterized protein (DUF2141 family)
MTARIKNLMYSITLFAAGAALFAGAVASVSAQAPDKCKLSVKVTGIRNTEGNVRVALRKGPEAVVQSVTAEIDAKTMTATAVFEGLPQGSYGVAVIHDENKNGKLDFNEMGMPLEGYGHSNNPGKRMGPPNFDETKFTLSQPAITVEIQLIYWP